MIRLLVFVVTFAIVVIGLPQWAPAGEFFQNVSRLPSQTAFLINAAALLLSAPVLFLITRQPGGWLYTRPGALTRLVYSGLLGLAIAALFELFEGLSGRATTIVNLILITVAFFAGEAVYQLGLTVWNRLKGKTAQKEAPTEETIAITTADLHHDQGGTRIPRLAITLPIYAFVLVFLPQNEDFRRLEGSLIQVPPLTSFGISIGALLICACIPWIYNRFNRPRPMTHGDNPYKIARKAHINHVLMMTGVIGLGFAALINIVSYFLNSLPSLSLLILIPLGFLIAEAVYNMIDWRARFPPI